MGRLPGTEVGRSDHSTRPTAPLRSAHFGTGEEAGTFSKITELFSRRAPAPSRSNEEENEKEDEPQTRHIMTAVDPEERETAAGSSTGEPKDREMQTDEIAMCLISPFPYSFLLPFNVSIRLWIRGAEEERKEKEGETGPALPTGELGGRLGRQIWRGAAAAAPAEHVGDRNDRNSKRQKISIMKRSKPSGATGRKRKKEQEESEILLTTQAHLSPPLQSSQILLTAQAHLSPPLRSPQILLTAQAHLNPPLQSPQILLTGQH
ncbi:hypothetical protein NQZ68_009936 [Dissostichus eleginoides]|nr:hypothetical protein NQZ68_009936 [Dissostichus eleginoides]